MSRARKLRIPLTRHQSLVLSTVVIAAYDSLDGSERESLGGTQAQLMELHHELSDASEHATYEVSEGGHIVRPQLTSKQYNNLMIALIDFPATRSTEQERARWFASDELAELRTKLTNAWNEGIVEDIGIEPSAWGSGVVRNGTLVAVDIHQTRGGAERDVARHEPLPDERVVLVSIRVEE